MNRQGFLFFGGAVLIFILVLIWVGANKMYQAPKTDIKMDISDNDACASSKDEDRQLCLRNVEQSLFENYLKANISDLSPTKEVLGGKFYITNISWLPDRVAVINYEDGHIALKARVALNAIYQDGWPETVEVKSFNVLSE
jgi:hypothetical protein